MSRMVVFPVWWKPLIARSPLVLSALFRMIKVPSSSLVGGSESGGLFGERGDLGERGFLEREGVVGTAVLVSLWIRGSDRTRDFPTAKALRCPSSATSSSCLMVMRPPVLHVWP